MRTEVDGHDVRIWIKVVPGASQDHIAGMLGPRLKVRTSAPPEGGKANQAVCRTIAHALGIKPARVAIESGQTNAEKVVRISDIEIESVRRALAE